MAANFRNPVTPERLAFGRALEDVFTDHAITHRQYAEFGTKLAMNQIPDRTLPYDEITLRGWLNGELLPSPLAYEAMGRQLKLPDHLNELYRAARTAERTGKTPQCPTELTHAMRCSLQLSGLTLTDVIEFRKSQDRTSHTVLSALSRVLIGSLSDTPTKDLTYSIEQLCQARAQNVWRPDLVAIHEQMLRERADILWEQYTENGHCDLGGLLRACRVRLGDTGKEFYERLYTVAGATFGIANHAAITESWETNKYIPSVKIGDERISLCDALVMAMKIADQSPEALAKSHVETPWFDAKKEAIVRKTFIRELHNGVRRRTPTPSAEIGPMPRVEESPVSVQQYQGRLSMQIIHGEDRATFFK